MNFGDPALFQRGDSRSEFSMTWPRPRPASAGQPTEATPSPTVQCLFCSHRNPADASYCNDCGSQLHLQPCERCGVLNLRTASACYKCGAILTLQAAPATAPTSASALHANQPAPAGGRDVVVTTQQEAPVSDAGTLPVADIRTTGADPTAASQRTWWAATAAILLATIAMSGYYYVERSPEFLQQLGAYPSEPRMASTRAVTPSASEPAAALGPPPPAPEMAVQPSPVMAAGGAEPPAPVLDKNCPDAVVALGLCPPNQERKEQ